MIPFGKLAPVPFTRNYRRNPLTPLPMPLHVFEDVDAILLTHRHSDHWDKKAMTVLSKSIPIFCQKKDRASLESSGFLKVISVNDSIEWEGIQMRRIEGLHATGITGKLLGRVSVFFVNTLTEGSIYIVSDCIYTPAIEKTFRELAPDFAILNASEAEMIWGTVITMTREEIVRLSRLSPKTKFLAVDLDTINHCKLSRNQLTKFLKEQYLENTVLVPQDGEVISF